MARTLQEENLSISIQCKSDPYPLNGIIVYDEETSLIPFAHNHHIRSMTYFNDKATTSPNNSDTPGENLLSHEPLVEGRRIKPPSHFSLDLQGTTAPLPCGKRNQWKAGLTIMLLLFIYLLRKLYE